MSFDPLCSSLETLFSKCELIKSDSWSTCDLTFFNSMKFKKIESTLILKFGWFKQVLNLSKASKKSNRTKTIKSQKIFAQLINRLMFDASSRQKQKISLSILQCSEKRRDLLEKHFLKVWIFGIRNSSIDVVNS